MNKPLLLTAVLLIAPAFVRADDEEDVPAPISGPEAAEAARDKGYRAEEAPETGTAGGAPAPITPRGDARVLSVPAQRPMGGGARPASSGAGGGKASSGGLSCDESAPKLSGGVAKKDVDLVKIMSEPVQRWSVPPHGAVSYKFTAPGPGAGTIVATMGADARPSPTLMTVSSVSCDFDVEKARAKKSLCHVWGPTENGLVLSVGGGKKAGCALNAGAVYYFNIRTLTNPEQGNVRDGCADQFDYNPGPAGGRKVCGGIWKISGAFEKAGAKK